MNKDEFVPARKKLGRTQKHLADLLGVSIKTIHSYEQGRREIPSHIERQIFFLLSNQRSRKQNLIPCWEKKQCGYKETCPAGSFRVGICAGFSAEPNAIAHLMPDGGTNYKTAVIARSSPPSWNRETEPKVEIMKTGDRQFMERASL